jgi:hypothetical protein
VGLDDGTPELMALGVVGRSSIAGRDEYGDCVVGIDNAGEFGTEKEAFGGRVGCWNGRIGRSEEKVASGRSKFAEFGGGKRGSLFALLVGWGRPLDFSRMYVSHFFMISFEDRSMLDEK